MLIRWPSRGARRRPRELFGPLAKWGHPIETHALGLHHTHRTEQLDRIAELVTEIRDLLRAREPDADEYSRAAMEALDGAVWCAEHQMLRGGCRGLEHACTCPHYVVDFSDPERYHPENLDRELDPNCPVHREVPR